MARKRRIGLTSDPETFRLTTGLDDSPVFPPPPQVTRHLEIWNKPPYDANMSLAFANSYTDCWTRFTLISNTVPLRMLIVLGFTEWIVNLRDNPPGMNWWPWGIAVQKNDNNWSVGTYNASIHTNVAHSDGTFALGSDPITVDLRARYDGVITYPHDRWHGECWINDTQIAWADLDLENSPPWNPLWTSIKGLAVPPHYGDYGITKMDDISAGTARGATDILSTVSFEDGTFGLFDLFDNDNGGDNPYRIIAD